jgi:hypothetical protein
MPMCDFDKYAPVMDVKSDSRIILSGPWADHSQAGPGLESSSAFQGAVVPSYARSALQDGMKAESALGENPFKFGMIGSTDSHTGLAAVKEKFF